MTTQEIAGSLYLLTRKSTNKDLGLLLISAHSLLDQSNLQEVTNAYTQLLNGEAQLVEVYSAVNLSDAQKTKIIEKANALFKVVNPIFVFQQDQSLLGGLVMKHGDFVYDESADSMVKNLSQEKE